MKAITKLFLSILTTFTFLPLIGTIEIKASTSVVYGDKDYSISCDSYSVDVVNDNGTFDNKGCYVDFDSAKDAMSQLGDDAVVRHASSYSATKIIAMNSGVAYTYTYRGGKSATVTLHEYTTNTTVYTRSNYEVAYTDTLSYDCDGTGTVRVNLSGFDGTIDLMYVDLVPMKYLKNGIGIYLCGNSVVENAQYVVPKHSFWKIEQNGNYTDVHFYAWNGYPADSSGTPEVYADCSVGPADVDWMTVGSVYYSPDGVNFYSDMEYRHFVGSYYSYYEWEPLRTKSNISASVFQSYLSYKNHSSSVYYDSCDAFITAQNTYGINALLLYAQASHESWYGESYYAKTKKNLFGVNAIDSNPNDAFAYNSVESAIYEQAYVQLKAYTKYAGAVYYGGFFGNKGSGVTCMYASDAYYGYKIAALAYDLDKYANNNNGNLSDYNANCYGVAVDGAMVYANTNGDATLYSTNFGHYQKNSMWAILSSEGDYYKVQSTQSLNDSDIFDWFNDVGYIKKSELTILFGSVKSSESEKGNSVVVEPSNNDTNSIVDMYRLYNPNSGEHFYTSNTSERDNLISLGWTYEGVGWSAPVTGTPVYRLYNSNGGEHHYTMSEDEKNNLVEAGWTDEGIGWYSADTNDSNVVALHREYNPNAFSNNHNYTKSSDEHNLLISLGWFDEGIAWYGY